MSDLIPCPGDWVASRAAVKRRGLRRVMRWHVSSISGERMRIFCHRYGFRQVTVGRWVMVERPGEAGDLARDEGAA